MMTFTVLISLLTLAVMNYGIWWSPVKRDKFTTIELLLLTGR